MKKKKKKNTINKSQVKFNGIILELDRFAKDYNDLPHEKFKEHWKNFQIVLKMLK